VEKLIIEAAINEQASRADNPRVPYAPEEIAAEALAAARAGAAIVHFHARDPVTGDMLHPGTESYRESMRLIRAENPDVLLYPTYGISPTPQERFSHLEALAQDPQIHCDFATIDPGAVNYGYLDEQSGEWMHDFVQSVTHAEARHFFELTQRYGILHSITVREIGQIRHAIAYHRLGWTRGTILFKLSFRDAMGFGLPPCAESIEIMTRPLITEDVPFEWMVYSEGPSHDRLSALAVAMGGHVRTGLGDNPLLAGKKLSNAEQVERVVEIAQRQGRELATPADVRQMLRPE
jgi:3-keto-5-aminohexanoate cleavage enzyme